jgi:hypothetical protein
MSRLLQALLGCCLFVISAQAADEGSPPVSAKELAAHLSTAEEGSSYVRLIMQIKDATGAVKSTLQLQIKQRRTAQVADIIYQVLWPKERNGEAVLLHQAAGSPATGSLWIPPGPVRQLDAGEMGQPLFGSDLSYQDAVENFFAWPNQSLAGTETIDRVNCVILESKPGDGEISIYGSVRSWIDARRLVAVRVEKYLASGKLARRIDTTRVADDDNSHPIPANLAVRDAANVSETDLDGSRIRHDVTFSDHDFSPDGLKDLAPPHFGR